MSDSVSVGPLGCQSCVRGPDGWPVQWCAVHEPPQVEAARYRRALEYVASLEGPGSTSGRFAAYVLAGGDLDAPHWIAAGEPLATRRTMDGR